MDFCPEIKPKCEITLVPFASIASQIAAGNAHPLLVGIKNPAEMFHILDTFPEVQSILLLV